MSLTPGPWEVVASATTCPTDWAVVADSRLKFVGDIEHEADARLIAAAPDLLEWLESVHDPESAHFGYGLVGRAEDGANLWGPVDYDADRSCGACAVIRKARGES
jgi:hypothetical protein